MPQIINAFSRKTLRMVVDTIQHVHISTTPAAAPRLVVAAASVSTIPKASTGKFPAPQAEAGDIVVDSKIVCFRKAREDEIASLEAQIVGGSCSHWAAQCSGRCLAGRYTVYTLQASVSAKGCLARKLCIKIRSVAAAEVDFLTTHPANKATQQPISQAAQPPDPSFSVWPGTVRLAS